jgi:hypothetical protein
MSADNSRRVNLLRTARSLCESFANKEPLDTILQHFSSNVVCLEHGLQNNSLPFLGREFEGQQGAKEYFTILSNLLDHDKMSFRDYVVDVESSIVCVRGEATFTFKSTCQSWNEVFTYRLAFDDLGDKIKIYEVWADSGAAYLASQAVPNNVKAQGSIPVEPQESEPVLQSACSRGAPSKK